MHRDRYTVRPTFKYIHLLISSIPHSRAQYIYNVQGIPVLSIWWLSHSIFERRGKEGKEKTYSRVLLRFIFSFSIALTVVSCAHLAIQQEITLKSATHE